MMPFAPTGRSTVTLSVTTSTGSRQIRPAIGTHSSVLVSNTGSAWAYVEFGDSAITAVVPSGATTGGVPVAPGSQQTFRNGATYAAAICGGSDSTTLAFTPGEGL